MTAELALQLFIYGLRSGSVLALNALGFAIVYGSVRILNFAHGEIFALSTVLVGTLIAVLGLGPTSTLPLLLLEVPLMLVGAMTFGAALNLLVERLAFRPFRGHSPLGALVATLAISLVRFQIALWWRTIVPPSTGSAPNPHHGAPNVPLRRVPDLFPSLELLAAAGLTSPVRLTLKALLIVLLAFGVSLGLATLLRQTRLLYVSLALGLNVVTGLAGLLDLGYAAFFALGGYTTALLTASGSRFATGLPVALGDSTVVVARERTIRHPGRLPAGTAWPNSSVSWASWAATSAALAGYLLALPALRMRPEYLPMTTLPFGEIVPGVIHHLDDWTGGSRGIAGIPRPRLFGTVLEEPAAWYEISLGLVVLAAVTTARLRSARQGRAWAAVSQDELAAASAGVAPVQVKLLAFALFASTVGYVEPGQFDFMLSMTTLAMVMVGGHAGISGTILGALVIASYDRFAISQTDTALRQLGTLSGVEFLRAADLRQANYLVFGLTLSITVLLRAAPWSHRRRPPCPTRRAPSPPDDRAARRSTKHHGP